MLAHDGISSVHTRNGPHIGSKLLVMLHSRCMMGFESTGQCCRHLFMACPASSVLTHARRRLSSPLLLSKDSGTLQVCFFGSHFGLRPQGLQLVLCCLMQRAPVPVPVLPMLLLYAILWRLRGSSVVLHDRVIATPAEPRLPRWVTLQPQQEPAPRRLLPGWSGSLLCNPTAGRHCCLALGCLLQQNTLLLTASSTAGHVS